MLKIASPIIIRKKFEENYYFAISSGLELQTEIDLNPNWHELWYFYLLLIFESDFVSLIFHQNFPNFLKVKIDINWEYFNTLLSLLRLLKVTPRWRYRWTFFFLSKVMPIRAKYLNFQKKTLLCRIISDAAFSWPELMERARRVLETCGNWTRWFDEHDRSMIFVSVKLIHWIMWKILKHLYRYLLS